MKFEEAITKLEKISPVDDTVWIINTLIRDYFITFMPTQIDSKEANLNKQVWYYFNEWCKKNVLLHFNIGTLLEDYKKGVASMGNLYKKSSRELNHVKLKF